MNKLVFDFKKYFKEDPEYLLDTGGRLEIIGNHTDHNHGLCIVGNCSLRVSASIKVTNDNLVRVISKGYREFSFSLNELEKTPEDEFKPRGLLKGVMNKLKEDGYKIGSFLMYIKSDVPNGSGVSSSAAIESLFGYAISYLFNEGKISNLEIAKVGQYAENVYFNKPCGLLDQIGTSFDSLNFIDFKNIKDPEVITLPFNLPLDIFLIKSLGNHSALTNLYSAIPSSMYNVAKLLEGKEYLGDIENVNSILQRIDGLKIDDSSKKKAKHFFLENENVLKAKNAIESNDVESFLDVIRRSQSSSKNNLENTFVKGEYDGSPQSIIDNVSEFIKDKGAIRIHGGGFKGTVILFMKKEYRHEILSFLNKNYKKDYFEVKISSKSSNFKKI